MHTTLLLPFLKNGNVQKAVAHRGVRIWNNVSCESKETASLSSFKLKIVVFNVTSYVVLVYM